jgi:hypothetical protein
MPDEKPVEEGRARPHRSPDAPDSADPVTARQLRDPGQVTMAGLDPEAMGEGIGVHDGSTHAGEPAFSTSQGAGQDVDEDITEGRVSTGEDVEAR